MSKTIVIEYFGKRFPRVVSLRNGTKVNFLEDRKTLELDEYDAMLLLKSNIRMNPTTFEFGIAAVIQEEEPLTHEEEEDANDEADEQDTEAESEGGDEGAGSGKDEQKPASQSKGKLKVSKGKNKNKR